MDELCDSLASVSIEQKRPAATSVLLVLQQEGADRVCLTIRPRWHEQQTVFVYDERMCAWLG